MSNFVDNSASLVADASLLIAPQAQVKYPPLHFQVGFDTDIGGGRENQDDFFVFQRQELGLSVFCVLDGHGREVGKIAANAAKERLLRFCHENFVDIMTNPVEWLVEAHRLAHIHIKESFRSELEHQGFEISEDPVGGYLLKRKNSLQPWACVHGGSSCTIVAIIGLTMYTANVGDSSATLCACAPVLSNSLVTHLVDAGLGEGSTLVHSPDPAAANPTDTIVVTAEHSPESPYEFLRLRDFRPRDGDPTEPSLLVVYDAPSCEKSRCTPVFEFDGNGVPCVTGKGRYYKNVRKEWASLVSTPLSARFQDALAFTRSLGDLHLHTYGVTNLPEVQRIELQPILEAASASLAASASSSTMAPAIAQIQPVLCLVVATDGVWDNWTYEDVTKFVLDPSCLGAVSAGSDGGHRVALSFMQRNGIYAKRNFQSQADNATGIIAYLSPSSSFPAAADVVR